MTGNYAYELTVAADAETRGCGAPGATVYVALFKDDQRYISERKLDWPSSKDAPFDANVEPSEPDTLVFDIVL